MCVLTAHLYVFLGELSSQILCLLRMLSCNLLSMKLQEFLVYSGFQPFTKHIIFLQIFYPILWVLFLLYLW